MKYLLFGFALALASCGNSARDETGSDTQDCFDLDNGSDITLEGYLTTQLFAGPPNYESIANGDEEVRAFILELPERRCAQQSLEPGIADTIEFDRVHVSAISDDNMMETLRSAVGHRIVVSGEGMVAHTAHHRAPMVLLVKDISGSTSPNSMQEVSGESEDYIDEDQRVFFVIGEANARDRPSSEQGEVIETYQLGDRVEGRRMLGLDQEARWLRIEDSGQVGYVWEGNLSGQRPSNPLEAGISFVDLQDCRPTSRLERIFAQMLDVGWVEGRSHRINPSIAIGEGVAPLSPTLTRRQVDGGPGSEELTSTMRLPRNSRWHGLRIVSLIRRWGRSMHGATAEEGWSVWRNDTVNFAESPSRLRDVLRDLGASIPISPDGELLSDMSTSVQIESAPEGSALRCSTFAD